MRRVHGGAGRRWAVPRAAAVRQEARRRLAAEPLGVDMATSFSEVRGVRSDAVLHGIVGDAFAEPLGADTAKCSSGALLHGSTGSLGAQPTPAEANEDGLGYEGEQVRRKAGKAVTK